MTMVKDDLLACLADATDLGMADACDYTTQAGPVITTTLACVEESGPNIEDVGGEVRRRTLQALGPAEDFAAPKREELVQIATGPYAGSWRIIAIGSRDSAGQLLTLREDARIRMRPPGVERMPQ